jgi:WD40 repeat protein
MSDDLPNTVIIDRILPFVDRSTWDNLVVANREIYEGSRNLEAPWPVGEVRGVGYEGHEINQLCFSSDGNYLCVRSSQDDGLVDQQRIRMWHNVVGSCGLAFDGNEDMCLWRVYFSPVENLLVSLHHDVDGRCDTFWLWEVNTGGIVFNVEVQLDGVVDMISCTFSRDGRHLMLHCADSTFRIYSVSDAQLIKVIHLNGNDGMYGDYLGITADGRQGVFVQNRFSSLGVTRVPRVRLCGIHEEGSTFEDVYVCHKGEHVSNIAISPLDDSIAIMTRAGIIKLAHRRARNITWTIEVLADGKCFDTPNLSYSTNGQLLATVRADKGIEIWDPIKGKCIRTIVCDQHSKLEFSPDGTLLAATTSSNAQLCLYNI